VAIFQDDIYYGTVGSFDGMFYDIGQVAVLRGPQGTTFGRNVVGGALQITSNKPLLGDTFGEVAASILDTPGFESQGFYNVDLGEKLAARVAYGLKNNDGWHKNLFTGADLNDRRAYAGRFMLRYQPTENVDLLFSVSGLHENNNAMGYRLYGQGAMVAAQDPDPYKTNLDIDGFNIRNINTGLFRADVKTSLGTFSSITGYRSLDFDYREDGDGTPLLLNDNYNYADEYQWSQEFRLVSPSDGRRLDYLVGVYAEYGRMRREHIYNFYPNPASRLSELIGGVFQHQVVVGTFTVKSLAPFGEIRYHFNDQLSLTAGARYTHEAKVGSIDHQGVSAFYGAEYYVTVKDSWNAFTPRVVLDYKPTDDVLIYASASKGFKGGGWPISVPVASRANIPLIPETSWSYELGAKTQWFDRRLTLNVAGYLAKTKNLQVRSFISGVLRDNNAGEAEVKGIEVESVVQPTRDLSLGLRYAYTDAKYKSFKDCAAGGADCTGNRMPASPENDLSLFGEYRLGLGDASLTFRTDVRWADEFELNPTNTQDLVVPKTAIKGLWNASVTYEPAGANWKLQLWGRNLTGRTYVVYAFNYNVFALTPVEARPVAQGGMGLVEADRASINPPRTFGATLTVKF
jgi:iron complex outermembrane receptor protein